MLSHKIMIVLLGCVFVGASCTAHETSVPDQLNLKVGSIIAGYSSGGVASGSLKRCGRRDMVIKEIRGNLILTDRDYWINLKVTKDIRICNLDPQSPLRNTL